MVKTLFSTSLFTNPLTRLQQCAIGYHAWLITDITSKAMCAICGEEGYCWHCPGLAIPPGAALHPCRLHRRVFHRLDDTVFPLTALGGSRA